MSEFVLGIRLFAAVSAGDLTAVNDQQTSNPIIPLRNSGLSGIVACDTRLQSTIVSAD